MNFRALLPVQAIDNLIAQLEHRKLQLPERPAAAAAQRALQVALAEATKSKSRQSEISKEVNRLESRGKDLDVKKAKYETQLKSVIAMREVEALQHEIASVNAEHSALDDAELLLLDENETLDKQLLDSHTTLPSLESSAAEAGAQLTAAVAATDAEIVAARAERITLVAATDAESLALYEGIRARMSSAAVAEILKGSCGGCHTSLSVKEQAEMKKIADTPDAVCPYCGCLLAV
jgi:hypothetical protein